MEAGSTSISKVTVEYHDPSGVFPLISRQLQSRLPLRDLHWKSTTRPLRSIDFLHVDLTPSKDVVAGGAQARQGTPIPAEGSTASVEGRRHQIPGLRQTPYVKVYLLRCDDNEAYKATSRKALREWWKKHTPASQSSSSKNPQENHDAFERLIIHVILPNTAAAGQPHSSNSSGKGDGGTSEKSGSSKGLLSRSNTILEKVKADFNVSSRSALDRVTQIRLRAEDVPQSLLPPKSSILPPDLEDSSQERADSLNDIVVKLKTLILSSFNLRVSQYEEDIRERNAQRTLPGWNFCTFFVLKEGLARGFESVGLVDDALVGYDELSIGLENAIQEQEGDGSSNRSDSFLSYTKELKDILVRSQVDDAMDEPAWDSSEKLVSASRKGYREMILGSNISVFDFQCYIFARQMTILLRMGILHSSEIASLRQDLKSAGGNQAETDNLSSLSELCQRASAFITSVSRVMRDDLRSAERAQDFQAHTGVIDNIVASWAYGVSEQILDETNVSSLPKTSPGQQDDNTLAKKTSDKAFHPARSSSLAHRANSGKSVKTEDTTKAVFDVLGQKLHSGSLNEPTPLINISDLEGLSAHRAELYTLQRQIMERTAEIKGWSMGLSKLHAAITNSKLKEVDLNDDKGSAQSSSTSSLEGHVPATMNLSGICQATLMSTVSTFDDFKSAFEELTNLALTNYLTAKRINSIERLLGDLALIKFDAGDFVAAANYLSRVTSSYADRQWGLIETSLLKIHAQCLKKLNRRDDYARMLLSMLAKTAAQQRSHLQLKLRKRLNSADPWQDDDHIETSGLLAELVKYSNELPYDMSVQMDKYFTNIAVEPYIQHFNDTDGFSVKLKLRHLLDEGLEIDSTRVRLTCSSDRAGREIWLESEGPAVLQSGINSIRVGANITAFNYFVVDKIIIKAKKICFEYDPVSKTDLNSMLGLVGQQDPVAVALRTRLLCYARPESFHTEIKLSRNIHIDKIRTLEIRCKSGWNDIRRADMHLRSASAGLRLRTADATLIGEGVKLQKSRIAGVMELIEMSPNTEITIRVPYNLEDDLDEILIRIDVTYVTPKGKFEYLANPTITTGLPIDVTVHDFFKSALLFSRFQIRPSRGVPLQLLNVNLEGTDRFSVQTPPCAATPLLVFPNQPANILYKIKQRAYGSTKSIPARQPAAEETPLTLTIDYGCIDEYGFEVAESRFREAVVGSHFKALNLLLIQTFNDHLRRTTPAAKFSRVALLNELHIPTFEAMEWNTLLESLPAALTADLRPWLQSWHEEHKVISIPQLSSEHDFDPEYPMHKITMNVPLPRLHVLQTASLSLPESGPAIFTTGCLIPATISIQHTRRWDTPLAIKSIISESETQLEFVFEVEAPHDQWLIGGQRRTRFSAQEDKVQTWTIMIMPQKVGRLLLPTVDVRIFGRGAEEISCETDSRSLGETVLVIGDLGSTTVGLSEGPGGTEAHLIESISRGLGI